MPLCLIWVQMLRCMTLYTCLTKTQFPSVTAQFPNKIVTYQFLEILDSQMAKSLMPNVQ